MSNLLSLFLHAQGTTEVPVAYYRWAFLSVVSACLADRVWVEKFRGSKLTPNLYTVLIGPSASGKGIAIDAATDLLIGLENRVRIYRGKVTAARMVDLLARKPRRLPNGELSPPGSKFYLVTPELSMSVGSGALADDFIKFMTELYTGGKYTFEHGTRTSGDVTFSGHNINWLGGSTESWFLESLTPSSVEGGALGRICAIKSDYDLDTRVAEPTPPPDADEVIEEVRRRLRELATVEGVFTKMVGYQDLDRQWYNTRPRPEDDALIPTWRRQHDLVYKLAMILALCETPPKLRLDREHFIGARELSYEAQEAVPALVAGCGVGLDMKHYQWVRSLIRTSGSLPHTVLCRRAGNRGLSATQLRNYIIQLQQGREIDTDVVGRGRVYRWRRRIITGGGNDNV